MTDAELEALVAQYPADPEFDRAISFLTIDELEQTLDGLMTRGQILAIGRTRADAGSTPPGATPIETH